MSGNVIYTSVTVAANPWQHQTDIFAREKLRQLGMSSKKAIVRVYYETPPFYWLITSGCKQCLSANDSSSGYNFAASWNCKDTTHPKGLDEFAEADILICLYSPEKILVGYDHLGSFNVKQKANIDLSTCSGTVTYLPKLLQLLTRYPAVQLGISTTINCPGFHGFIFYHGATAVKLEWEDPNYGVGRQMPWLLHKWTPTVSWTHPKFKQFKVVSQ